MKSILSILTLILFLNIAPSVGASEGTCIQGNCNNGYGIFVFDDGRVYEGQWEKGLFDGMGKLIFISGSKYTGEFKKGLMHGYGKIILLNGSEKKCEVINGDIQVDEPTKQLWLKETTSKIGKHIVYLKVGDVYKEHRNYDKSLEYYNKSLSINPNYTEAINSKNEIEKKIAEIEVKNEAQKAPKIVLQGGQGGHYRQHEFYTSDSSFESKSVEATSNDTSLESQQSGGTSSYKIAGEMKRLQEKIDYANSPECRSLSKNTTVFIDSSKDANCQKSAEAYSKKLQLLNDDPDSYFYKKEEMERLQSLPSHKNQYKSPFQQGIDPETGQMKTFIQY